MHDDATHEHADQDRAVPPPGAARRAHPREAGFGWTARLPSGACLPVLDFSAGGMRLGWRPETGAIPAAGPARLDVLAADGAVVTTDLDCFILRVAGDALAVRFATTQTELAARHLQFMARLALAAIRPIGRPGHG